MSPDQLRALQAPLKARYRENSFSAVVTLKARGRLHLENVSCKVETGKAPAASRGHARYQWS